MSSNKLKVNGDVQLYDGSKGCVKSSSPQSQTIIGDSGEEITTPIVTLDGEATTFEKFVGDMKASFTSNSASGDLSVTIGDKKCNVTIKEVQNGVCAQNYVSGGKIKQKIDSINTRFTNMGKKSTLKNDTNNVVDSSKIRGCVVWGATDGSAKYVGDLYKVGNIYVGYINLLGAGFNTSTHIMGIFYSTNHFGFDGNNKLQFKYRVNGETYTYDVKYSVNFKNYYIDNIPATLSDNNKEIYHDICLDGSSIIHNNTNAKTTTATQNFYNTYIKPYFEFASKPIQSNTLYVPEYVYDATNNTNNIVTLAFKFDATSDVDGRLFTYTHKVDTSWNGGSVFSGLPTNLSTAHKGDILSTKFWYTTKLFDGKDDPYRFDLDVNMIIE